MSNKFAYQLLTKSFLLFAYPRIKKIANYVVQITKSVVFANVYELSCASVSKRVQVQNHFYDNDFELHDHEPVCRTHFHMNGFRNWTRFDTEGNGLL